MKTFKKYGLVLFFVTLLFAIGCKKEEKEDIGEISCTISEFADNYLYEDEYGYSFDETSTNTFTYDEAGKLTLLSMSYEMEHCYPEDATSICDSYSETYDYSFTYNGERISNITFTADGEDEYSITVAYAGDQISKLTESDEEDFSDEYRLIYDNDRIVRIENWDNYSFEEDGFHLYAAIGFTYSNGNVTKTEMYYNDEADGGGRSTRKRLLRTLAKNSSNQRKAEEVLVEEVTFTYDDQSNPFSGSVFLIFTGTIDFSWVLSKNNPISRSFKYTDEADPYSATSISYTYNDQGYPVSATTDDGEGDESEVMFSYSNCK